MCVCDSTCMCVCPCARARTRRSRVGVRVHICLRGIARVKLGKDTTQCHTLPVRESQRDRKDRGERENRESKTEHEGANSTHFAIQWQVRRLDIQ
jgi:hypothetical protein